MGVYTTIVSTALRLERGERGGTGGEANTKRMRHSQGGAIKSRSSRQEDETLSGCALKEVETKRKEIFQVVYRKQKLQPRERDTFSVCTESRSKNQEDETLSWCALKRSKNQEGETLSGCALKRSKNQEGETLSGCALKVEVKSNQVKHFQGVH